MIEFLFPIIVAILFHFLAATLIWWSDIWEREPFPEIVVRIIWGGIPAIIITISISIIFDLFSLETGIIADAAIEEFAKGLGIIFVFSSKYPFRKSRFSTESETDIRNILALLSFKMLRSESQGEREIDSPLDGLIYGAMVGLGFSLMEDIGYYGNFIGSSEELMLFVILRSIFLGLGHVCFSGFLGLGIVYGMTQKGIYRTIYPLFGLLVAITYHTLFNYSIIFGLDKTILVYIPIVILFIGLLILFIQQERKWIYEELTEEANTNLLTTEQIDLVLSPHFRIKTDWNFHIRKDPSARNMNKFLRTCSKLGLKKHRSKNSGFNPSAFSEISALKKDVHRLGKIIGDDLQTRTVRSSKCI